MNLEVALTQAQKDALYVRYFGNLKNPAIVTHRMDGKYISNVNGKEIPASDIEHLGMGVMIQPESLGRSGWF